MSTLRAPSLYKSMETVKVDELMEEEVQAFKQRQHQLLLDFQLLFFICFWLEINYWWWYPISVSLIQKENPSGVVERRWCSDDHHHLVMRGKTAQRKHTNPFPGGLSDVQSVTISLLLDTAVCIHGPLAQVTGCRAQMSERILALMLFWSDWLGARPKAHMAYRVDQKHGCEVQKVYATFS